MICFYCGMNGNQPPIDLVDIFGIIKYERLMQDEVGDKETEMPWQKDNNQR